jgi:hypothetical protein
MSVFIRLLPPVLFAVLVCLGLTSFCGFYVARADVQLLNKASQVIIVRDGDLTVLTMSNDFQGDVREFAMVVPVPEVLRRDQIRLADAGIFQKLDAYSGPRLVEYHDEGPCPPAAGMGDMAAVPDMAAVSKPEKEAPVNIEAKYRVGEYDVLILGARESGALKEWLVQNGYRVPPRAEEVLDPYVKSGLKFFVVKVNLEAHQAGGYGNLRPLQLEFSSPRFMLPIRLGMANAEDFQDLIVYAFSKKGRVETTNYRTVESPTGLEVPTFVRDRFSEFYAAAWEKTWSAQRNAVFLEYAWDLGSGNFVKCDPCASDPPLMADLREAGIPWLTGKKDDGMGGSDYEGELYMTRLHLRYDRATFPQDLVFQETPDRENFQIRYVMNHPAADLNCEGAAAYFKQVYERRVKELATLASITGWDPAQYSAYTEEYRRLAEDAGMEVPGAEGSGSGGANPWIAIGVLVGVLVPIFLSRKMKKP